MGESTFQCAIRETEEETSLVVDETWLTGPPFMEDVCNLYYPMCPPDLIILLGLMWPPDPIILLGLTRCLSL